MRVKDSAKSAAAEGSGCRETDGVGAGQNDGRDLLRAHAMTLRIDVAITRMARTTPYPSERDPMVKSRSKISRQPVKKSKKTPARTTGARIREKSRSAKSVARRAPSQTAAKGKWVYTFGGGKASGRADVRNLLGGKGAGLAEMAHLGLPVPPGFTISTEVCTYFYQNGKTYPKDLQRQVEAALAEVGRITGKKFGDGKNPLLVSVRSGARASMPGMLDTVLNLGLNDVTAAALAEKSGDRRFAYDSYRRFITMYSDVVLGIAHHHFEEILDVPKDRNG
jgi:pyruvate,orthophosphate dikinase